MILEVESGKRAASAAGQLCLTGRRSTVVRVVGGLACWLLLFIGAAHADCENQAPAHKTGLPASFGFAAVGDLIVQRPSMAIIQEKASGIVRQLQDADVSFGNFESNSFALEGFAGRPTPYSFNQAMLLSPTVVPRELRSMGFTLVSHANNHARDWGVEGVLATNRTLCAAGLVQAGAGPDLNSARMPAYVVGKNGGTVALVAVTSTFENGTEAGEGRPGPDGLHVSRQGADFVMDETDRRGLLASVAEARARADLVFFSLHTHEAGPGVGQPTAFEIALAHQTIDAGGDVFFGHGPHELRGIEIYKGRPIFYSLANFAVAPGPPALNTKPFTPPPGSVFTRRAFFQSVLATGRYDHGQLVEVRLYPFELADTDKLETTRLPEAVSPDEARAILERLQGMSQPFGTRISIENGVGVIRVAADTKP